jgi:hypothetical protein
MHAVPCGAAPDQQFMWLCSYLSVYQTAPEFCTTRMLSLTEAAAGNANTTVSYEPVTYGPVVPPECSEAYRHALHDRYKLYNPPLQENTTLMHGQAPENGGENARPPPQDMLRAPPPKVQVSTPYKDTTAICEDCRDGAVAPYD